ncbi:type II toxin-antitoxin system PemK/MazF family toxin [Leuconostoc carnosum]|uniref:type II toxin-antitoxin system PemK/MazF family toxin n=1 Tax=Leuconostoc TaxID=1243 RepID=UPI000D50C40A|nr:MULTISPECIES: type II toxin-antitoxin system PemK/MazF family toxin [Leuconostoc]KAA8324885.1 type II toxin-antitoxin system PemK/MazF family toxin [Leuconostoc carnosum]KAA8358821.1 type II toxin-antitoxin system PemK/MazF family toxin [Leuconostoc carnosum]KAA8364991.1 type II toxin-antitoxin system PemK/MazF family toxin [Leuconostoc carnosum]KAA8365739.1 type II toxin-antitoxin system PemK/MazF family toxin [Leuconostoc carnosum]KAA8371962.1 type II toxin-antitoxin system PemK/MazF fami
MTDEHQTIMRGDIFYADLKQGIGSEQAGIRPVLIIQNDVGNANSPTTIIAAITSQISKPKLPTHILLPAHMGGMKKDSVILAEQVRTIDKRRLRDKIAHINASSQEMQQVAHALRISVGIK